MNQLQQEVQSKDTSRRHFLATATGALAAFQFTDYICCNRENKLTTSDTDTVTVTETDPRLVRIVALSESNSLEYNPGYSKQELMKTALQLAGKPWFDQLHDLQALYIIFFELQTIENITLNVSDQVQFLSHSLDRLGELAEVGEIVELINATEHYQILEPIVSTLHSSISGEFLDLTNTVKHIGLSDNPKLFSIKDIKKKSILHNLKELITMDFNDNLLGFIRPLSEIKNAWKPSYRAGIIKEALRLLFATDTEVWQGDQGACSVAPHASFFFGNYENKAEATRLLTNILGTADELLLPNREKYIRPDQYTKPDGTSRKMLQQCVQNIFMDIMNGPDKVFDPQLHKVEKESNSDTSLTAAARLATVLFGQKFEACSVSNYSRTEIRQKLLNDKTHPLKIVALNSERNSKKEWVGHALLYKFTQDDRMHFRDSNNYLDLLTDPGIPKDQEFSNGMIIFEIEDAATGEISMRTQDFEETLWGAIVASNEKVTSNQEQHTITISTEELQQLNKLLKSKQNPERNPIKRLIKNIRPLSAFLYGISLTLFFGSALLHFCFGRNAPQQKDSKTVDPETKNQPDIYW